MKSMALIYYFVINSFILFVCMTQINVAFQFGPSMQLQKNIKCIENEKQALLSFKQAVIDIPGILSSWNTSLYDDCCNWRGIQCSNVTNHHHIIKLDLHGSYDTYLTGECLRGEVSSSLAQLSHLNYLDLSANHLDRIHLEEIGCSLTNLNYLNLSDNWFQSVIPPHLGNLSKLSILDLGSNQWSNIDNFRWLSGLSSLKHLDLSGVVFHVGNDWTSAINNLPLLQTLSLSHCNLPPLILPSHSYTNFSKFLVEVDLSFNRNLNSSIYYSWLINSTNLAHLNLESTDLQGLNLDDFGHMTSLVSLNLARTQIDFHSGLNSFSNLCNLNSLDLSVNNIGGSLSDFLKDLPSCVLNSFESLRLSLNNFIGFLPNFTVLPSLKELDLFCNMLNGSIPTDLGELSNLEFLSLSSNLLEGEVSEIHFSKLTHLRFLDLSNNSLSLNFKLDWVPPFQLETVDLSHCRLGPFFPRWLQTQNFLSMIDISFVEISDTIPHLFWNNLSSNFEFINFSGNKIMGEIPNLSIKFKQLTYFYLDSNEFMGRIPSFLFQSTNLDLSNNKFSDFTSLSENFSYHLKTLDLSNNQLSGQLPLDFMPNLYLLDLSNNYFSGDLPHSISNLFSLNFLILRNNQFSGGLRHLLNLESLTIFDAMNNSFSEILPSWIGLKLLNLAMLNLRLNHFHGDLPLSLCNLQNIQVLDISSNDISGTIPTCIHNFTLMSQTSYKDVSNLDYGDIVMMYKGQERLITKGLVRLERSIDLSSNHLTGKIPDEITQLVGLITLNLSRNQLTSQIPDNIGRLQSLEFLDLSRNHLCGPIPTSISQISRLPVLDLSHNNLSGKIPTGTQLQSFPTSSYEDNPYLCGDPLKKCFEEPKINNNNVRVENKNEDEHKIFLREFFISMTFGYIVGFWGIFGTMIFHRRWRHAYFKFVGHLFN